MKWQPESCSTCKHLAWGRTAHKAVCGLDYDGYGDVAVTYCIQRGSGYPITCPLRRFPELEADPEFQRMPEKQQLRLVLVTLKLKEL